MAAFELDPQLAEDTVFVGDFDLCAVRLMKDARFPWLILTPRKQSASEIFDLTAAERAMLIEEIARASSALKQATGADKINVGALGNIVRQLHIHVAARFERDAAWPGPIWGSGAARPYAPGEAQAFAEKLKIALGL